MNVTVEGATLKFGGVLSEHSALDSVRQTLDKVWTSFPGKRISFDFSGVKRANSTGILGWLRLVKNANVPYQYQNAPIWLVGQFNLVKEFLVGDAYVESVQAPFYCPVDDAHEVVILTIGRDVPLRKNYDGFSITCTGQNGTRLEPDFEAEEYFRFISENFETFERIGT